MPRIRNREYPWIAPPKSRLDFQRWSPTQLMSFIERVCAPLNDPDTVNIIRGLNLDGDIIWQIAEEPEDTKLLPINDEAYKRIRQKATRLRQRYKASQQRKVMRYNNRRLRRRLRPRHRRVRRAVPEAQAPPPAAPQAPWWQHPQWAGLFEPGLALDIVQGFYEGMLQDHGPNPRIQQHVDQIRREMREGRGRPWGQLQPQDNAPARGPQDYRIGYVPNPQNARNPPPANPFLGGLPRPNERRPEPEVQREVNRLVPEMQQRQMQVEAPPRPVIRAPPEQAREQVMQQPQNDARAPPAPNPPNAPNPPPAQPFLWRFLGPNERAAMIQERRAEPEVQREMNRRLLLEMQERQGIFEAQVEQVAAARERLMEIARAGRQQQPRNDARAPPTPNVQADPIRRNPPNPQNALNGPPAPNVQNDARAPPTPNPQNAPNPPPAQPFLVGLLRPDERAARRQERGLELEGMNRFLLGILERQRQLEAPPRPVIRAPPEQVEQFQAARVRMMEQARERARVGRQQQQLQNGARAPAGPNDGPIRPNPPMPRNAPNDEIDHGGLGNFRATMQAFRNAVIDQVYE